MRPLTRFIVALVAFPLIGAYSWRWAGLFIQDVLLATGVVWGGVQEGLDLLGCLIGLVGGLWCTVQVVGCAFQPRDSAVCATGDVLEAVMGVTLVADLILIAALGGTSAADFIPPANLALWSATAAAVFRLSRVRKAVRRQQQRRPGVPRHSPESDHWAESDHEIYRR